AESASSFWSAQTRTNWPIRLFQVQLSLIYLASVQAKLSGQLWLGGTAVSYVLRLQDMQRVPLPQWFVTNALAMNVMTWGALAIELGVGILIWVPRLRPWALASGVLLHMMIDIFIQIGIFSYAIYVMYLAWLSPNGVKYLPDRLRQLRSRPRTVQGEPSQPEGVADEPADPGPGVVSR
ncbi:MAG: hypothetical protein QOH57_2380, partial [Mycobacterium sp.]|nr:hypothetical protein [Mycobacterium sp.]